MLMGIPHDNLDHRGLSRVTRKPFGQGRGRFLKKQPQIQMKRGYNGFKGSSMRTLKCYLTAS